MTGVHLRHSQIWTDELPVFARDRELALLLGLLEKSRAGTGNLTLLSGEVGIGKTALAHDLARHAEQSGIRVLLGRAFDLAGTPPFQAWREALRPALAIEPFGDRVERSPESRFSSEHQMFEALGDSLLDLTSITPLLLILEDIHWADSSTLDLLRYISRRLHEMRLTILATYRDDHHAAAPVDQQSLLRLVRESVPPAVRIRLSGLDAEATRQIVRRHCELRSDDEDRLVKYLADRSSGNPLFINELLRSIEEDGMLERRNDDWILGDLRQLQVPTLIRHVIENRLARLNDETISLLQVAAVIGQAVPIELWKTVSSVSEDHLIETAEEPMRMNILEPDSLKIDLRFSHALIRETLYEMLTLPRRRVWHRRVAEAMANQGLSPATVAFHFDRAGDRRAIEWYLQAGLHARSVSWSASVQAVERALALMEQFGVEIGEIGWTRLRLGLLYRFARPQAALQEAERAMQNAQRAGDPVLSSCARYLRGSELFVIGRIESGVSEMQCAVDALSSLEFRDRQRYRRLAQSWFQSDGLAPEANLVAVLAHQGDFAAVQRLDARRTPRSGSMRAPDQQLGFDEPHALAGFAIAAAVNGDPDSARATFSEAIREFETIGEHVLAASTALWANLWLALTCFTDDRQYRCDLADTAASNWSLARGAQGGWTPEMAWLPVWLHGGDWEQADAVAREALSGRAASPRFEIANLILARNAYERDEHVTARTVIARVLTSGPDTRPGGHYYYPAMELQFLAAKMAIDAGEKEVSQRWLSSIWRWLEWSGAQLGRAQYHLLLAESQRSTGEIDAAHSSAAIGHRLASNPRQPMILVQCDRLLAEILIDTENLAEARSHLERALELAIACRSPLEEALCRLSLARISGSQDDQMARLELKRARSLADELDAKRVARIAKEVAATHGFHSTTGAQDGPPLTPREREVLRLLVTGATNADIASQMFVSRRTVEQHLRSIYRKLGVRSRVAATREALNSDLV